MLQLTEEIGEVARDGITPPQVWLKGTSANCGKRARKALR